jgi:hypothetical protein
MNISESGMLLQPSIDAQVGQEVRLEFRIEEMRASLNVSSRIVRKEGNERMAVEFTGLQPEDQNAVQVYVTGHMKDSTPRSGLSDAQPPRMFRR